MHITGVIAYDWRQAYNNYMITEIPTVAARSIFLNYLEAWQDHTLSVSHDPAAPKAHLPRLVVISSVLFALQKSKKNSIISFIQLIITDNRLE